MRKIGKTNGSRKKREVIAEKKLQKRKQEMGEKIDEPGVFLIIALAMKKINKIKKLIVLPGFDF